MTADELKRNYPEIAEMAEMTEMPIDLACAAMESYEQLSQQELAKMFFVLFLISVGAAQVNPGEDILGTGGIHTA